MQVLIKKNNILYAFEWVWKFAIHPENQYWKGWGDRQEASECTKDII